MMSSSSEPPPPPPPPPRVRRIDGPMLPHLHLSSPETTTTANNNSLASLVPILTPPTASAGNNGEDQRYVLVPESRRIIVRGARRGTRVRDLVAPSRDDDGDDGASSGGGGTIRSVALAWLPRVPSLSSSSSDDDDSDGDGDGDDDDEVGGEVEGKEGEWVILAGCSGGIVHEWSASDLSSSSSSDDDGGASCLRPRRSFRLTRGSKTADLTHLASPSSSESPPDDDAHDDLPAAVVYGLIDEGGGDALVRFAVPPFVPARRGGAGGDGDDVDWHDGQ